MQLMRPHPLSLFALRMMVIAACLCLMPLHSRADYLLDSGDVLEISVFDVPALTRRATVNVDGKVSIPFVGEVVAAGTTLTDLRRTLQELLVANNVIRDPKVAIELVEHRPFYIKGHVARPGAHPYRPGITVRHAVALAGGYDLTRFRVENPLFSTADLRGEYESLWIEFVKREARVARLKSELEGKGEVDLSHLEEAPTAKRIVSEIARLEKQQLKARLLDSEREKTHLKQVIKHSDNEIEALDQQQRQEEISVKLHEEELARTRTLHDKGLTPTVRLSEEQRAAAMMKSRLLENTAEAADARRRREDSDRKLQKVDDQRRMDLLRELQDANVELEKTRNELQATGEKLVYAGVIKSQMAEAGQSEPEIFIFRKTGPERSRLTAEEDTDVLPGDLIEIVLKPEYMAQTPSR